MCTTMMALTTLALLLRRYFDNRVRPHAGDLGETDPAYTQSGQDSTAQK